MIAQRLNDPGQKRRLNKLQRIDPFKSCTDGKTLNKTKIEGSVNKMDSTFTGNPVKTVKRKRMISKDRLNDSNIYNSMDTGKENSTLMAKINDKIKQTIESNTFINKRQNTAETIIGRKSIPVVKMMSKKNKRGLSIVRMKPIKK